jgi:predicted glutamine amidotransferase
LCRLVGVAGKIYGGEKKAFRNLLEQGAYNSPHSTGVAVIDAKDEVKLLKVVGRPWHLYDEYRDDFDDDDTVKGYGYKILMGHNRFATVGKKIPENAHPFKHGNITGAHNGTLDQKWLSNIDGSDKFDVDSEALIYSFDKNGWRETLNKTKGAWAIVWHDKRNGRLNFIRNNERPLHYCFSMDRQNFYWASEEWMLEVCLGSAGVKYQKIQEFDPYKIHYIKFKDDGALEGNLMYVDEEVKGFVPPPFVYQGGNAFKHGGNGGNAPFHSSPNTEHRPTTNFGGTSTETKTNSEAQNFIDNATKSLIGQVIPFQTFGERTPKGGMAHILCDSNRVNNLYEIRIYSEHNPRHAEWRDSQQYFLGRVKSAVCNWDPISGKWDRYITLDMRTISEGMVLPPTVAQIVEANASPRKHEVIVLDKKRPTNVVPLIPKKPDEQKAAEELKKEMDIVFGNKWDPNAEYTGYQGRILTFSQFMSAIKSGCSECGQEPSAIEADHLVWVGPKSFICQICDHRHRTEDALQRNNK